MFHQTNTLTAGVDNFTGGAGDDTFNAVYNVVDGATNDEATLGAFDTINGGDGVDTIKIINQDDAVTLPAATISNVEIIDISAAGGVTADTSVSSITGVTTIIAKATAGAVDIDTKADVTSVSVTGTATTVDIDDAGTSATSADKIATVSIAGASGAITLNSDALTSLTLTGITADAADTTITAAAATRELSVTLNGVDTAAGSIDVTDGEATSLKISTTGAASDDVTFVVAKATSVTIAADEAVDIASLDANVAKSITVTGDSVVQVLATAGLGALETVDSSGSTGGVVFTPQLATGVTFTGGAGKDTISLGATTKAHTMGAGDDTVTVGADFDTGGTVDAGAGADTLKMTATLANTLSANATFEGKISNFEKLELTTLAETSVNLANLDDISTVSLAAGAFTLTLNNFANNGTVNSLGATTGVVVNVKDALVGGNNSDVLNYNTTIATSGANVDFGALTAAGVETVNLDTSRTGTVVALDANQLDLTLANVVTLNVTGNVIADIDGVDLASATLQTINASTNTGGLQVSTAGATQGIAITGSATKANTITGGNGGDTITGGAGVDTINAGTGANVVSAGAGDDTITFTMQVGAGDTMTGGAGSDTFIMAATTAATFTKQIITDFDLGTSTTAVDDIQVSITAIKGLTTVTDLVDTSGVTAIATNGTVVKLGTDGATIAGADLVVIDTAIFADATAMLAGLKAAGAATITYGSALQANDAFLIAFSDGTHSYIAVATSSEANLLSSEGVDSVEIIAQLNNINLAGLANFDTSDYSIIA